MSNKKQQNILIQKLIEDKYFSNNSASFLQFLLFVIGLVMLISAPIIKSWIALIDGLIFLKIASQ